MGRGSLLGVTWGTEGAFLVEKQQVQRPGREVEGGGRELVSSCQSSLASRQPRSLLPLLIPGPLGRLPSPS